MDAQDKEPMSPDDFMADAQDAIVNHDPNQLVRLVMAYHNQAAHRRPKKEPPPGWELGEFYRTVMHCRGITRQQLADHSGLSMASINHILAGYVARLDSDTAQKLNQGLGLSPN